MLRVLTRTSGFTLVELIVGMLIFSIGMTGILALLHSTINNSLYSRYEIVAGNLLREEIELVKNIRNSNVRNFIPYDSVIIDGSTATGLASGTYIVENNFAYSGVSIQSTDGKVLKMPVKLKPITLTGDIANRFSLSRLYLDAQGRYTHTPTATGTIYASYIIISPLTFSDGDDNTIAVEKDGKTQWYTIDARVLVQSRGYQEYDLKSLITDWKK